MVNEQKKYITQMDSKLRDLEKTLINKSSIQANKEGRIK